MANHSWGGNGYSLAMLNAINNPVSTNDPLPVGLSSSFSQEVNTFTMTGSASEIGKIKVGMGVSGAGIRLDTLVTIVSGSTITLSDFTSSAGSNVSLSFFNPTRGKPYGVVHVAAAGNSRFNADRIPTYPACLPSGFMICVGAADSGDNVSLWGAAGSNFGRLNVDLFAPGTSIWSTKWKAPGDAAYGYESRNGTSMAAPQVSAALALARMWQPKLSELQARQIVIDQVDVIPALQGKCFSSGRLNIAKTIDRLYQPILVSSGGGTGGTGLITEALAGAVALSGRLAVATTGYSSHALAIVGDRVWSWGSNGWGELGDATIGFDAERSAPAEIAGLNDVRMLAAGDNFSMALKADGTVWVWGSNVHGQHGKGTKDNFFHPTPQKVSGLSEITWISTAALERPYCLAVRADGKVFAWGDNSLGQLGDGTTTEHLTPQMVPGLSDIVQVDAGPDHALALTKNGEVYAWGSRFGQAGWQIYGRADTYGNFGWNSIGDGPDAPSLADSKSPVLVPNLGGIVQVEATMEYSLAVDQTGAVWEWGHFPQGYFQNLVANIGSHTPVLKQGLNEVVAISSGVFHSFAQTSNGEVFSWGLGSFGSLGNGREDDLLAPQSVVVTPGDAIVSVAAGQFQSLAVTVEGKLLAWGLNHRGQIGTGRSAGKGYPSRVRFADSLADVVTDGTTQFGLSTSGRLYVWGFVGDSNAAGFKVYQTPKLLPSPVDIVDIDIGLGNMFAVSSTGSLYFVDTNDPNLGWAELPVYDNNPASGLIRKQIKGVATTHFYYDPLAEPTENNIHALFITTDGKVKGFGGNAHGQLGNNSTTNMWWPLQVTATAEGLSSVKQVAAGVGHSMALKEDGTVWTWGRNNRGQLGNGTLNGRSTPGQVQGLSGIVRISAGDNFSAAIKSDGTVYAWGGTNGVTFPELSIIDRLSPVMINGLGAVEDVVPGLTAMFVQRVDGTALAWSADFFSDYGDRVLARDPASLIARSTPAGVVGLSGIRHLAQEYQGLAFAVKSDGSLWSWGGGTALDVLGDGDSWVNLPTYVVGFGGASYTLSTLGTSDTTDSWMFQNFSISELLDDSVVSDAATPAEDGIPNLVKYALGLNPKQRYGGASLPTPRVDLIGAAAQSTGMEGGIGLFSAPTVDLTSGRRYLAFTVLRNGIHLDINYIVEVSADLQNWMSGNPFTITVLDTAETLEVYDATALEDAPKRFMRLRIQRK